MSVIALPLSKARRVRFCLYIPCGVVVECGGGEGLSCQAVQRVRQSFLRALLLSLEELFLHPGDSRSGGRPLTVAILRVHEREREENAAGVCSSSLLSKASNRRVTEGTRVFCSFLRLCLLSSCMQFEVRSVVAFPRQTLSRVSWVESSACAFFSSCLQFPRVSSLHSAELSPR